MKAFSRFLIFSRIGKTWPGLLVSFFVATSFVCLHGIQIGLSVLVVITSYFLCYFTLRQFFRAEVSIFISLACFLFLSFLPDSALDETLIVIAVVAGLILASSAKPFLISLKAQLIQFRYARNIQIITIALAGFIISLSLIEVPNGYLLYDGFHPFYELSIGNSFGESILAAQDLSFSGKALRTHFLSSRLPYLLDHFGLENILVSTYIKTPFWILSVLLHILYLLFSRFPSLKPPLFLLFFLPLAFVLPLPESIAFRTIFASPSFSLGLCLVLLAFLLFVQSKPFYAYACLTLLALVKAPFFVTMSFGLAIFYFVKRSYRDLLIAAIILSTIFLLTFFPFMSGAHSHNHWAIFPSYLAYLFRPEGLQVRHWLGMGMLIAFCVVPIISLKKCKLKEYELLLLCLAFSGFILSALLSEITETNGMQFFIAAMPFTVFSLYIFLTRLIRIKLKNAFVALLFFASFLNLAYILKTVYLKQIRELAFTLPFVNSTYSNIKGKEAQRAKPDLSLEMLEGYLSLRSQPGGVVLYANYEKYGFSRSALSAKTFYTENFWFKGVSTEPTFPERLARTFAFYQTASRSPCDDVYEIEKILQKKANSRALPLGEMKGPFDPLLYRLSFNKEWSRHNLEGKILEEIRKSALLSDTSLATQFAFIMDAGISYICFESACEPIKEISDLCEPIFSGEEVRILKINREKLNDKLVQYRNARM